MKTVYDFVNIDVSANKDYINTLKTKGAAAVRCEAFLSRDNEEVKGKLMAFAENVKSVKLDWNLKFDISKLLMGVLQETGPDQRMFVRKSERSLFEETHKIIESLAGVVAPQYVELNTEAFEVMESIKFSFEEQTRMMNAVINGVKSVAPQCKIVLATSKATDNEMAKKWYNRFQVSGGKPFDIISIKYGMDAAELYDLSCNMGDLSRRFEAEIIVDASGVDGQTDITFDDLKSAVSMVSLDRGLGIVYSEVAFGVVEKVA
ncbi:MAG: glycosyl hydrolase 53 family protein [Eubacterium sp.]|nr:glycosyl hydrolase 53 family protein [Eubacterium sp.]